MTEEQEEALRTAGVTPKLYIYEYICVFYLLFTVTISLRELEGSHAYFEFVEEFLFKDFCFIVGQSETCIF